MSSQGYADTRAGQGERAAARHVRISSRRDLGAHAPVVFARPRRQTSQTTTDSAWPMRGSRFVLCDVGGSRPDRERELAERSVPGAAPTGSGAAGWCGVPRQGLLTPSPHMR